MLKMLKRLIIEVLRVIGGVGGNIIAGGIQEDTWSFAFTLERVPGTLIGVLLISFIIVLLESENTLVRFRYLRDLLHDKKLRDWEAHFARLQLAGAQRVGAEVRLPDNKRHDLVEVLLEVIAGRRGKDRRALVLGEPGSGKTTGLERLTLELARKGARRLGLRSLMPILVRLGGFQTGELFKYIAKSIQYGTERSSGEALSKGLEEVLKEGRTVLLFDAFDEALGERRRDVLAQLKDFLESRAFKNVPVVITSRTKEDPGEGLKISHIFEIQDLNNEAVKAFIRVYKQSEHSEEGIWNRLNSHHLLEDGGLGRNPFWLKLIVESGAFVGNMGNKGQILNKAVEILLRREWDKPEVQRTWQRVLPKNVQLIETKLALAWLGYWMSSENQVSLEKDKAIEIVQSRLKKNISAKKFTPDDVLGLGQDAQLLVYKPGPVRFRHRLLQEFMAAWMLMIDKKLRNKELDRCAKDTGWWETLFLLGGIIAKNESLEDYCQFVQNVLGDGTSDQRLFVAIGLLRSVNNPPQELENRIFEAFASSISRKPTSKQVSAAQALVRILGEKATKTFGQVLKSPEKLIKQRGLDMLLALDDESTYRLLKNEIKNEIKP